MACLYPARSIALSAEAALASIREMIAVRSTFLPSISRSMTVLPMAAKPNVSADARVASVIRETISSGVFFVISLLLRLGFHILSIGEGVAGRFPVARPHADMREVRA